MKVLIRILAAIAVLAGAAVAVALALQESQKSRYISLDEQE